MAASFLRWQKQILVVVDAVAVVMTFYLAWFIRYQLQWYRTVDPAYYTDFSFYLRVSLLAAVLIVAAFYLEGLYRLPPGTSYLDEVYRVFNGTATVTIILMVGNYMFQPPYHSRLVYGIAGVLAFFFVILERLIIRQLVAFWRKRGIGTKRVLLVGAGESSRRIMRVLLANTALGYTVVGFLDDNPERGLRNLGPFVALGPLENLPEVLKDQHIDEVIVTLPWQYHRRIISVLDQCERQGKRTRVVPDVLQMSLDRVDVEVLDGIPLLGVKYVAISGPRFALKRALDLLIGAVAVLLLLPFMGLLALLVKLDSAGPVLFIQQRIGKDGVPFNTYKFRSMVVEAETLRAELSERNEADGPLFKIKNDPRTTRVGRHLRRYSLDELPQLINVLLGDMSLVGPRPALPEEVAKYEPWHRKRLDVLPGMTGLWQVSGRSDLGFDEMMLLDIYYVENWSPLLDVSIMVRTVPKVLIGNGAY